MTIYFAEPFLCTDDQINVQFFTDIVSDKDSILKKLCHHDTPSLRLILTSGTIVSGQGIKPRLMCGPLLWQRMVVNLANWT